MNVTGGRTGPMASNLQPRLRSVVRGTAAGNRSIRRSGHS